MKAIPTKLDGVVIIEPDVFADDRGFFLETYHRHRYAELLRLDVEFVQDNHSHSIKGVLRGLHLQRRNPQGKLVRVVAGHVWDVAADVNPVSRTFKQWIGVELTGDNRRQLYIPPGYAHGFCVMSEAADVEYKCTTYFDRDDEVGILWCDIDLAIDWPIRNPVLSQRDQTNEPLASFLRA
jgi:dTDP-4-dehydrorhamnose 3,5-epimerase